MTKSKRPLKIFTETTRFTLSWETSEDVVHLKFNNAVWPYFVDAAKNRGIPPEELISVAVARLIGKIIDYRLRA